MFLFFPLFNLIKADVFQKHDIGYSFVNSKNDFLSFILNIPVGLDL